ncbi:hypothetical protein OsccyDRAFT_5076 [Leptolyngbyaceae cyanobacterium JSC-12]|nr:hypothetical protein OsccyDRAFT_5076 [Leptolyngbyaceae cyanobacterium JSC-12]
MHSEVTLLVSCLTILTEHQLSATHSLRPYSITAKVSSCRSPLTRQRSPLNSLHCYVSWSTHRSPPQPRLTDRLLSVFGTTDRPSRLLGAFATTDNPQTTASTDHFLGAFGRTGNPEELVQRSRSQLTIELTGWRYPLQLTDNL